MTLNKSKESKTAHYLYFFFDVKMTIRKKNDYKEIFDEHFVERKRFHANFR
jgi:hypothetical protein